MSMATRALASQLVRTNGQGIAVFVQERVHSTDVGLEATSAFVLQLLAELESGAEETLAATEQLAQLTQDQEAELGSLLSASSLTVRYVTERDAMTPVVSRFRAVFLRVLQAPAWTDAILRLKMVALMGLTRILEAFGESVTVSDVEQDLEWLFSLFGSDELCHRRLNGLFRPTCEYLSVAIQSHPTCQAHAFERELPALLRLVTTLSQAESGRGVDDSVRVELASTIAVLLDLRLAVRRTDVLNTLELPSFLQLALAVDRSDEDDDDIFTAEVDENATPPTALNLAQSDAVEKACDELSKWLSVEGRRSAAITLLPYLAQAVQQHSSLSGLTSVLLRGVIASVSILELRSAADFEFFRATIEALRDLGKRDVSIPKDQLDDIYEIIQHAMPKMQEALAQLDTDKATLKSIKMTCSSTRDALSEAFVVWLHQAGGKHAADRWQEIVDQVIEKLADPRVYGDLVFVVRNNANGSETQQLIERALHPIHRALRQLGRYSKASAARVLTGLARIIVAAGIQTTSFADALMVPLISTLVNRETSGKSRRLVLASASCVLLNCSEDPSFEFDQHRWVEELLDIIMSLAIEFDLFGLMTLNAMVQANDRLRSLIAVTFASSTDVMGGIMHQCLTVWPIYEEDIDTVATVLQILEKLLLEHDVRAIVEDDTLETTLKQLQTNAELDGMTDIARSCQSVRSILKPIA
ncbi:hypothetical protein PINS_up001424 [Pythium insidiosum]|nr:hypothetical protein PINS_up001424 [Pythium insidiosum]